MGSVSYGLHKGLNSDVNNEDVCYCNRLQRIPFPESLGSLSE